MDEWIDGLMDERDGDGRMDERMNGRMDEWMNEWMSGRVDEWMTSGRMNE